MRRVILVLTLLLLPSLLSGGERPNFHLSGSLGGNLSNGFLQGGPGVSGALGLGVAIDDRLEGSWGLAYHALPGMPVTLSKPTASDPDATIPLRPTDDLFLSIGLKWYPWEKWDRPRGRFREAPYLLTAAGLGFVVDQYVRPEGLAFYNAAYDVLFGLDLGAGMDFPLGDGRQWLLFVEGLDHLLFWQGLTHVICVRGGIKVMLDSEHLDPFR